MDAHKILLMKSFVVVVLSIIMLSQSVQAKDKLVFSGLRNSKLGVMVEEVLKQAYRRIGIESEIRWLPGMRALQMADNGEVDGAQLRVAGIRKKYTHLLMIPVPVYVTQIVAFSKDPEISVDGWGSLKPYRLGAPNGYTAILDNIQGFNFWEVTYVQIFKMLDKNHVDLGIVDRFNGTITVHDLQLKDIHILDLPLAEIAFYHFLHEKHRPLVPRITASLQQMEQEGEIRQIWTRFEKAFTGDAP